MFNNIIYNKFGEGLAKIEVFQLLSLFIEHPTKPGYKRKDIQLFIKLMNNE
jgi:hypothetical protein